MTSQYELFTVLPAPVFDGLLVNPSHEGLGKPDVFAADLFNQHRWPKIPKIKMKTENIVWYIFGCVINCDGNWEYNCLTKSFQTCNTAIDKQTTKETFTFKQGEFEMTATLFLAVLGLCTSTKNVSFRSSPDVELKQERHERYNTDTTISVPLLWLDESAGSYYQTPLRCSKH